MNTANKIFVIAAIGRNRELGHGNDLLWHIPEDLKRFRSFTAGHPCIMGRKTFESIVEITGSHLKNRSNIVVSRGDYKHEGAIVMSSIDTAIKKASECDGGEQIYVIGGAQIYALALPYADMLRLTRIDAEAPEADAFFPKYEGEFARVIRSEPHEYNGLSYEFIDLARIE